MNIKIRLSFQFTAIVFIILMLFAVLVYYFSYTSQLKRYREDLLNSAKNSATLLIDVTEVDSTLLKKIQRETILLDEEEIVITNASSTLIYSNNTKHLTDSLINSYFTQDDVGYFSVGEKDGVFYNHVFRDQTYKVLVLANDNTRRKNLADLKKILFWSVLLCLLLLTMLSYFFASNAIRPISKIIKSVKNINSAKLSERLRVGKGNDEIVLLARTFNEMLANLEVAFSNQKEFVSNASHELRTPLSVMILESDFLLNKSRSEEEYKEHVVALVNNLKRLNAQLNSLLELAQTTNDKKIQLQPLRLDEVVFDAIHQLKSKYPERKIISKIQYPENENELLVNGNAGLLSMVFRNLIDNACKFSDEDVLVEFDIVDKLIKITVSDKGLGIPADEIDSIYNPFKRASNVKFKSGFGIGLSIVFKILELHGIELTVNSQLNRGTQFTMLVKKQNIA